MQEHACSGDVLSNRLTWELDRKYASENCKVVAELRGGVAAYLISKEAAK